MSNDNNPKNAVTVIAKSLLEPEFDQRISNALPSNVTKQRFLSAAISAVRSFKEINECDRATVYSSVIDAARAGLLPDGKQGALVAFNVKRGDSYVKEARFMPMVAGIIHQLGNVGINAYAVSVYANDFIELVNDESGQHVTHKPKMFGDRGERVGALAAARTKDGGTYVETIDMNDIARIMAVSKQKDRNGNHFGPWKDWPERMEQKSALHRLARRIPKPDGFSLPPEPDDDDAVVSVTPEAPPPVEQEAPKPAKRPRSLQAVVDQAPPIEQAPPHTEEFSEELF